MIKPWMIIGGVALGIAVLGSAPIPAAGVKWFRRLQRPSWLTFEKAIPLIWTVVFIGGAWSAYSVWQQAPGSSGTWTLMGAYALLEGVTVAYSTVMLWVKKLTVGLVIGATGLVIALLLAIAVLPLTITAAALLLPYLIWSPIGTYTTWVMMQLNPAET
ncbi:MAG: TspO protein [Leptolyngbyaceae cyanobacterium SM1_1_3]|nr:TspO protein [Leptolyngbyaceae cyanobacterium SM1_1_3]NJN04698.1 TspO protein [Leptolyngbyaceae cyanobacterium RM1_1_2]NJO11455.1 TspO protein [Leptolyngbyaceae cyanobacterium SL_1_1]